MVLSTLQILILVDSLESTIVFGQQIWFHSRTTKSGKEFGYVIRKSVDTQGYYLECYDAATFKQLQQSLNWLSKRTELAEISVLNGKELPDNFFSSIPNFDSIFVSSESNVAEEGMVEEFLEEEHFIVPVSDLSNTVVSVKLTAAEKKKLATASK